MGLSRGKKDVGARCSACKHREPITTQYVRERLERGLRDAFAGVPSEGIEAGHPNYAAGYLRGTVTEAIDLLHALDGRLCLFCSADAARKRRTPDDAMNVGP